MSYLLSDTRVPNFLVYRSSNQPDVPGMMFLLLLLTIHDSGAIYIAPPSITSLTGNLLPGVTKTRH
jgi:hypothetical protein